MTARLLPVANFRGMAGAVMARPGLALSGQLFAGGAHATADDAVTRLYEEQARFLLGLAALLAWVTAGQGAPLSPEVTVAAQPDIESASAAGSGSAEFAAMGAAPAPDAAWSIAEEIVHDAFAAMHREWRRLRDVDRAAAYLRHAVVHAVRARDRNILPGEPVMSASSDRVLGALRRLPGRQQEALVLRYYADLPEAPAAAAMGVTRAAFRGHASRGMIALRLLL
jgi:hypothetical protein